MASTILVTVPEFKAHLNFTNDIGDQEDRLLDYKLQAAEAYIQTALGYRIVDRYGSAPRDLHEAILQLAAWWYTNREAAGDGAREVPFGVSEVIRARRDWSF